MSKKQKQQLNPDVIKMLMDMNERLGKVEGQLTSLKWIIGILIASLIPIAAKILLS